VSERKMLDFRRMDVCLAVIVIFGIFVIIFFIFIIPFFLMVISVIMMDIFFIYCHYFCYPRSINRSDFWYFLSLFLLFF
jgi:hypothetical protein